MPILHVAWQEPHFISANERIKATFNIPGRYDKRQESSIPVVRSIWRHEFDRQRRLNNSFPWHHSFDFRHQTLPYGHRRKHRRIVDGRYGLQGHLRSAGLEIQENTPIRFRDIRALDTTTPFPWLRMRKIPFPNTPLTWLNKHACFEVPVPLFWWEMLMFTNEQSLMLISFWQILAAVEVDSSN